MYADDVVKACFRLEPKVQRTPGIEIPRPALNDPCNSFIRFLADQPDGLFPATRRKASICSPTVAERPGSVTVLRGPMPAVSIRAA